MVGTSQKWPAKAGGRSPKGPAVAGTTVESGASLGKKYQISFNSPLCHVTFCYGPAVFLLFVFRSSRLLFYDSWQYLCPISAYFLLGAIQVLL